MEGAAVFGDLMSKIAVGLILLIVIGWMLSELFKKGGN